METSLVVRALHSRLRTSAVFFVPVTENLAGLTSGHAAAPEMSEATVEAVRERMLAWIVGSSGATVEESLTVADLSWQVLIGATCSASGERIGAVGVARRSETAPGWSASELSAVRLSASLCESCAGSESGNRPVPSQSGLDALVTQVAVELMTVSANSFNEALEWTLFPTACRPPRGPREGDRAIVDATVRLAQAFGLDVVAEGVETVELVNELLSLGCYRAQGFLLCRPKPHAEHAPLLLKGGIHPSTFNRRDPALIHT